MLIETLQLGPVATNCYIYSSDGIRAVVIDPAAEAEEIAGHLRALELEPVAIINTHGHLDHTGANEGLKALLDVPIYIGEGDAPYLGPGAESLHRQDALIIGPEAVALFQEHYTVSPAADVLLREGDEVAEAGLTVVNTPGHTAGSISLVGRSFIFSGDALFAGSIGRTDLCGGDERTLISSVKTKILTLPAKTEVFPGHGPPTTVGEERSHNPCVAVG
jgi:glyoxylase-like metal-dependent hydrolase (beta-lactamase superfamily II)